MSYLDSETDGEGLELYQRRGFKKADDGHVDMTLCRIEGVSTLMAMISTTVMVYLVVTSKRF